MNKLPYEHIWFTLDDYLIDNTFGKPYLKTVPSKWKKEFSTVTEMYETIMLDIQYHINLFFDEFFSHVDINTLPVNKYKLIKFACYSTFTSKLYGMLITDKNIKQSFANNAGYSIEENLTRDSNHYLDIFTPSALKALNQTGIKQLQARGSWKETFANIKDKNFEYIYTAEEIDELIEIIRIESENLFKDIALYIEVALDNYKNNLITNKDFILSIATSMIETEDTLEKVVEKVIDETMIVLPELIIKDEIFVNSIKVGVTNFIQSDEKLKEIISQNTADILDDDEKFLSILKDSIFKLLKEDKQTIEDLANEILKNEDFKNELISNINIDLTNKIVGVENKVIQLEKLVQTLKENIDLQGILIEELKNSKANVSDLTDMSNYYNKTEIGDISQLPYSTKLTESFNKVNKNYEESK